MTNVIAITEALDRSIALVDSACQRAVQAERARCLQVLLDHFLRDGAPAPEWMKTVANEIAQKGNQ